MLSGKRLWRGQHGMSMVETLVVSAISIIVFTAAVMIFTSQQTTFRNQRDTANVHSLGRFGMDALVRELRQAGLGLPVSLGVVSATADAVSLRINSDGVSTRVAADVAAGSPVVTVSDASAFAAGDKIIVYNIFDPSNYDLLTVASVAGNSITVNSSFANAYSSLQAVEVNKYHQIDVALDNANNKVTRTMDGDSPVVLINRVAANGLTLAFKDELGNVLATPVAAPQNVRKIEISLTMRDTYNQNADAVFKSDVSLRNINS